MDRENYGSIIVTISGALSRAINGAIYRARSGAVSGDVGGAISGAIIKNKENNIEHYGYILFYFCYSHWTRWIWIYIFLLLDMMDIMDIVLCLEYGYNILFEEGVL